MEFKCLLLIGRCQTILISDWLFLTKPKIFEETMSEDKYKYQAASSTSGNQRFQIKKAEVAYMLLWLFMLVAWSSILIGLVFTFRINKHHCENCRSQPLCRDTTPA